MKLPLFTILCAALLLSETLHAENFGASKPAGYFKVPITAESDNYIGLPLARPIVFSGIVSGSNSTNSFAVSPVSWDSNQFVYAAPDQRETYYVEFISGSLHGLSYKITANTANALTLDTRGDSLTSVPLHTNHAAALSVGDKFVIRPCWRIKDAFENPDGTPVIEPRPIFLSAKDEIQLYTDEATIAPNKPPTVSIYYLTGAGWRANNQGDTDYSDYVIKPNDAVVIRRRSTNPLEIVNKGSVLTRKNILFFPGSDGVLNNDTHFAINYPAGIKLDNSGLRIADQAYSAMIDSPVIFAIRDTLMAYNIGTGYNRAPARIYFYYNNIKWTRTGFPNEEVGQLVKLEPGKAYIIRKHFFVPGNRYWVSEPPY